MKTIPFLVLTLLASAGICWAQSDPGRVQNTNFAAPIQSVSDAMALFQPQLTPTTQTSAAIAEAYTPDIQALAVNLGNDPTRIFNYVHDQIRYVHYFGSKKGAELTLLERSGNDFDQCALLSALLQAAGYSPGYGFAVMKMPYDSPNHQDLHHWLGLSMVNTNWTTTLNYFSYFLGERGNYVFLQFDTNTLGFQRMWVTLTLGGTNYYLDPSFKVSEPIAGISLTNALGGTGAGISNSLMTAAGGTDTGTYVTGLNESSLRGALQSCNSTLLNYLSNNVPDASVAEVIGGQQIVSSTGLPLPTSLAFSLYTNSTYPLLNWTNQPTNFMGTFSISFGGTNQTWYTPQLQGQRVSLTFSSNGLAQLWLEDTQIFQTTNLGASNTVNVILSVTHPYGGWNTSQNIPIDAGVSVGFDRSSTNAYQTTNASYAIMYAFEANQAWLTERQQKLDTYLVAGYPNGSRQVTTETLNVMGLNWLVQTELSEELLSQEWGQLPQNHHRFGRMAQEAGRGYYVDVYMQLDGTFPSTGFGANDILADNEVFDVSSYIWSAMEHGIIEQLQSSNLVAASTVKMIETANTNSQAVYLASSANWTTGAGVRSNLVNYGSTLTTLDGLISGGYTLLLPQNGSNHVAGTNTWAGDGYVQLKVTANSRSMGMIIGGGYNGGYVSDPSATPSAPVITSIDESQPNYFNPQSATLPLSGQTGADPVNLVDGSFEITSSDLTLGQTEPRGLNLTRYYSSARRNSNPAGMAPGWLHSYYCNLLPTSAPQIALGGGTAQQMAPMIVATCAALNLYNNTAPDPKNWTVTALIAKWGIDQITGNAVSVNLGNNTLQFVKQPGGLYSPPGNCTMSLLQTNGGYWLQERHGRTFEFGASNLLAQIVDQYGQAMTFAYNSNRLVTNVTDWKSRSLTFTYANGVLTGVADSTGRSVSYGYTGTNLTSYTDTEQKTNSYIYDTNSDVIATFDALNNLIVTNSYDGFGHITTQLTQGDTNKTWRVYASGYYTVEVDPAGGQSVLTYDNKSRLISSQDTLGNVTQMSYDGQDHVVQTVSPLGETNQFTYDANNNLTETIDPLGYSNQYFYDASFNLIRTVDKNTNSSYFGYNSKFQLIASTNGAGDWMTNFYDPTYGFLSSRTDTGGTATYGYDTYGQLNNVIYPGNLGTNLYLNNSLGDVLLVTNPRGFTNGFQYNLRRQLTQTTGPTNLTTKIAYDAVGNAVTNIDALSHSTAFLWSPTRRLLATTMPSTTQGTPIITNTYDTRDWLIKTLDPLQYPTTNGYDPAERLLSVTDPLLRTTAMTYDNDGRKVTVTNAAMQGIVQQWNARSQLTNTIDQMSKNILKGYDAVGNLILLTNRNSHFWQFQFDAANRLISTITPTLKSNNLVFDHQGLLRTNTDFNRQVATFGYDALGRLTSRTDLVATTTFVYDLNGNLATNSEGGESLVRQFDAYDRLINYTDAAGNLIKYGYDNNGNLTNLVYPGNRTVTYAYDNLNRLTTVTDWTSRQTTYTYDLDSRVTSVTRPNGTVRSNFYDAAGQLTNIVEQAASHAPIAFFSLIWNSAARVQREFMAPTNQPYTPPSRTLAYDADNRLTNFNGAVIVNDNNGNMTSGPLTNSTLVTYTYDARNRLLNTDGVDYGYDPANNRVAITNATFTNSYVIDPKSSQVLIRIKNGVTTYYVYGLGLIYEEDDTTTSTNTITYHYDYRGSTVALTDGSGNVTDRIQYSAYGMVTYRAGTNDTPFQFNGRYGVQTDPNGLLYMRARYYNPYICRFINPDPAGFAGGLNSYAFVDGNPVSLTDPFGLWTWSQVGSFALHLGEGIVVGAVITAVVIVAAPAIAAAGAAAIVASSEALAAVGVGAVVSAETAATVATGVVDTGLLIAGGVGLGLNGADTAVNISQGNWNAVAFNTGNLVGGYGVGVGPFGGSTSGGRYLADALGEIGGSGASRAPQLSPIDLPGALQYEWQSRLRLNAANSDLGAWSASAPTPFSGGASATGIASGIGSGADLVNQYGPTALDWLGNLISPSSGTTSH